MRQHPKSTDPNTTSSDEEVNPFARLGLAAPLLRAVTDAGYETPTAIQDKAIPPALAGRDVLGCAQTGTGKTAAFVLPLLQRMTADQPKSEGQRRGRRRPTRALIMAPTRELAAQIGESIETYGRQSQLRHVVIFGGVKQRPQETALRGGVDIIVATPGRLLDLMGQSLISLAQVEHLVIDEFDRMLDQGFWPTIRRIVQQVPRERQTLLFSATMPSQLTRLVDELTRERVSVSVAPAASTPELVDQQVRLVARADKRRLLEGLLRDAAITRALVFTRTKHGANRVAKQLGQAGIEADAIHGNKSQNARTRALGAFRTGDLRVLVATDLAARGIDVDDVSHVINFDLPVDAESYVHRIGRTARAGRCGQALSFCTNEERSQLQRIERLIGRRLPVSGDAGPASASGDESARRTRQPRRSPAPQRRRPSASAAQPDAPRRRRRRRPAAELRSA